MAETITLVQIILYSIDDVPEKVIKTVSDGKIYEGIFTEETSIYNPTVTFTISESEQSSICKYNYAYIYLFQRYYFITDIVAVSYRRVRISFRTDVLMSFQSSILNYQGLITRTADPSVTDKTLYDPLRPVNQTVKTVCTDVGNLTPVVSDTAVNCDFGIPENYPDILSTDPEIFTLVIAQSYPYFNGTASVSYGTAYKSSEQIKIPTASQSVLGKVYTTGIINNAYYMVLSLKQSSYTAVMEYLKDKENLKQSIVASYGYPMGFFDNQESGTEIDEITFGSNVITWDSISSSASKPHIVTNRAFVIADFYIPLTYVNDSVYAPWEYSELINYELWLPYVGWIDLDRDVIQPGPSVSGHGHRIQVIYIPAFTSGTCQVHVVDTTASVLLYTTSIQLGTPLGLTTSNQQSINDNNVISGVSGAIKALGSLSAIGTGVLSGNPISVAGGTLSLGSALANLTTTRLLQHSVVKGTVSNPTSGSFAPLNVYLKLSYKEPTFYSSDSDSWSRYILNNGLPCNKVLKLDDLAGYYTVLDNVSDFKPSGATEREIKEIRQLLMNGVII